MRGTPVPFLEENPPRIKTLKELSITPHVLKTTGDPPSQIYRVLKCSAQNHRLTCQLKNGNPLIGTRQRFVKNLRLISTVA